MLSPVFHVLSMIGIILLILLGICVLLLLLVFFFPISYKIQGEKEDKIAFSLRVSWLFGLLRVLYQYPSPNELQIKLLWHKLFPRTKKKKRQKKSKQSKEKKNSCEAKEPKEKKTQSNMDCSTTDVSEENSHTESPNSTSEANKENDNSKGKNIFQKIQYTFISLYDKIRNTFDSLNYYISLLSDSETKALFAKFKQKLGKIWHHLKPRHLRADITFGANSPDTTGYLTGVYGMLSPWLGPKVIFRPNFTEEILEGNFYASGHITIFTILVNTIWIVTDQNFKEFMRKLKKETSGEKEH